MDINDYLLDQEGLDFDALFSEWSEIVPTSFTVWLVNRFGDMFIVLEDESVSMLDVGTGQLEPLAADRDAFCGKIDQGDNASHWFMIPLVDRLVQNGQVLKKGECYSFTVPPLLGGKYEMENIKICDLYVYYSFMGQIATKAKDVPDGTKVNLKVVRE